MSKLCYRTMIPFCTAASYVDMQECIYYEPISDKDPVCLFTDEITGIYDGQPACCYNATADGEADVIYASKIQPSDTSRVDPIVSSILVPKVKTPALTLAEKNKAILAQHGYEPDTPGVKYHPDSHMWIFRLKARNSPMVDFCAAKNKWKDVRTSKVLFGDAEQLVIYLKSKGNKGGSKTPGCPDTASGDS